MGDPFDTLLGAPGSREKKQASGTLGNRLQVVVMGMKKNCGNLRKGEQKNNIFCNFSNTSGRLCKHLSFKLGLVAGYYRPDERASRPDPFAVPPLKSAEQKKIESPGLLLGQFPR